MTELFIDRQAVSEKCEHCGNTYAVSRGSVYENGVPFALYIAGMHGCNGEPIVALAIATKPSMIEDLPSAITLQIRPSETEFQIRIIDPEISPWLSHTYLGRMLTRQEALDSPLKALFFRIADVIVTTNPEVNSFLNI